MATEAKGQRVNINGKATDVLFKDAAAREQLANSREQLANIREQLANIGKTVYPVGAYYISEKSTSPASLFGGTWIELSGKFLYARDTSHPAGSGGGEAQHTLTADEMPNHSHEIWTKYGNGDRSTWAYLGTDDYATAKYPSDGIRRVSAAGGGQAHNNMPPYKSVYMWYRMS